MRKAATALIFGFALLMILLIYMTNMLVIVQRIAVVDAVVGESRLFVHGRGDPVPVQAAKLVRAGDVVETGPASSVELRWARWAGGMRMKIGPDTRFKIARAIVNTSTEHEESRLRVDFGRIWVRLRRALTGRSKFEVETPTVVAAVRGTVFSVGVARDGATEVEVYEGRVTVSGKGGATGTLTSGSQVLVGRSQQGMDTRPLSRQEVILWQSQTSMVGPFLAVISPVEGVTVDDASIRVAGRVEPGAALLVNGEPVAVSETGKFSVTVSAEEGSNTLVVTARDTVGRETTVVRTVLRATSDD